MANHELEIAIKEELKKKIAKEIKAIFIFAYLGLYVSLAQLYHSVFHEASISEIITLDKIIFLGLEIWALAVIFYNYPCLRPENWLKAILRTIAFSAILSAISATSWALISSNLNEDLVFNSASLILVGIAIFTASIFLREPETVTW